MIQYSAFQFQLIFLNLQNASILIVVTAQGKCLILLKDNIEAKRCNTVNLNNINEMRSCYTDVNKTS